MSDKVIPAWSSTAVYTAGMEVLEDGVLYIANWWTSGASPAANSGSAGTGQPWTVIASSANRSTAETTPVPALAVATAPTALAATDVTSSSAVLSWAAPATPRGTTISGYTIFDDGKAIGTSTTNSFTLAGLTASTSYSLTVEADDATGASAASAVLTVKTAAATTTPPNYSNVAAWKATTVYTGGQDVTENNIVYVANYWTQNDNPAADSGAAGDPWTAIGKVDNAPEAPNAPTGLSATTLSSSSVALLWKPATVTDYGAVSGYAIYENGKEIGITSNTYFNVDGLAASTRYSFTVSAIDVTGASPFSTAVAATTLATGQSLTPTAVLAPYYDMGLDGADNLVAESEASGIKTFTLAFIQSSGTDTIGWAGGGTIAGATVPDGAGTTILSQIQAFQAIGGNVIISFGGENGVDPAAVAGATVAGLEAEYQSVINTYGVKDLDFDIEGGQVADTASINLRDQALAALEKANPGLQVSFTLPVLPTGLDANGLNVIQSAEAAGVTLSVVNIMTMDFGGSFDTGQSMGAMAIEAIQATEAQLAAIGETAKIGVTPLIGVNDDSAEVFTLADAQHLADYVATDPDVARVAYWSVARDNGSDATEPSATSSGVAETNYEYAAILEQTTAAVAAPVATLPVPSTPTGLTAQKTTSSSTALSWTAATVKGGTVSGYDVYENGKQIATVTGTSYTATGLTAATAYRFTVAAADSAGVSAQTSAITVTTSAASSGSSGSSAIPAWSATATYTAGETVQENGLIYKAGWWTQGNNPLTNSGIAGSGEVWTVIGKVDTTPTAPDAPIGLVATAVSGTTIDLDWTAATIAGSGTISGYDIFENGKQIATTSATYADVTGLTAATAYRFTVAAVDGTGASPQSTAVSATTLAAGTQASNAVFSPYVDMSLSATPSLVAIAAASGVKDLTLAFIQSSGAGQIGWGGEGTIAGDTLPDGATIQSEVKALQAMGGQATISFGGAAGTDPAVAAASAGETAAQLQAEYQSVITRYGVSSLDFDIEGAAEANQASLTLRDAAVKGLEAANPGLTVSYTLPVLPTGLDGNGIAIIDTAVKDGVDINVINIMAMDYGSAVDHGGAMGTDAIDAIQATEKQLATAGLHAKIGVTPMIGVNDTSTEVFTLADAQQLASYVATDPQVAGVSMWSMGRDNGSEAGAAYASPTGSGLTQNPYAFSAILQHA